MQRKRDKWETVPHTKNTNWVGLCCCCKVLPRSDVCKVEKAASSLEVTAEHLLCHMHCR